MRLSGFQHFPLYSHRRTAAGLSRFASREAEGTGPVTPRQPAQSAQGANPGRMPSVGKEPE
jgi:hypothetical protein